jgi:hypothetical protein
MFCSKCGIELKEESKFCHSCGNASIVGTKTPDSPSSEIPEGENKHGEEAGDVINAESEEIKCKCNNCDQHIAFDKSMAGAEVTCPGCGIETVLYMPREITKKNSDKSKVKKILIFGLVVGFIIILSLSLSFKLGSDDASELGSDDASEKQIQKIVNILERNSDIDTRFSYRMSDTELDNEEGRLKDFTEERINEVNAIIFELEQANYPRINYLKNFRDLYIYENNARIRKSRFSAKMAGITGKFDNETKAEKFAISTTMSDIESFISEINRLSEEEINKRRDFLGNRPDLESWNMKFDKVVTGEVAFGEFKSGAFNNSNQQSSSNDTSTNLTKDDINKIIIEAQNGNPHAQAQLGMMYFNGSHRLPKDDKIAIEWCLRAAQQGNDTGQLQTGVLYLILNEKMVIRGIKRNPEYDIEGYKWLYIASQKGHELDQSTKEIINRNVTQRQISEGQKRASKFTPKKE